jgi:uncharacterized membrane protein YoaK (UPF0700 family)
MELSFPVRRVTLLQVDWLLVAVLSTTAGAVDVIGFLALGGLFTAHITGNLVVLAAHYATGRYSEIGPLLSVPVFIAVLWITVLIANKVSGNTRRALLVVHAVLLTGFLAFGVRCGPFTDPDSAIPVFVGMLGVAAMATQNALVKLDPAGFPSTAVLTTNTVQLTIDLAVLVRGRGDPEDFSRVRRRVRLTFPSVAGFIAGCSAGGFLEVHFGFWALALPVVLAATAIPLGEAVNRNIT